MSEYDIHCTKRARASSSSRDVHASFLSPSTAFDSYADYYGIGASFLRHKISYPTGKCVPETSSIELIEQPVQIVSDARPASPTPEPMCVDNFPQEANHRCLHVPDDDEEEYDQDSESLSRKQQDIDSDSSCSDDDDSADSLADFVEDDEDMPAEADEALAQLRANTASSFSSLIYYVVRCITDKTYVQSLCNAKSKELCTELAIVSSRSAICMWGAPGDRASMLMESAVWMHSLKDDLRSYCVAKLRALKPTDVHYGQDCSVCRRPGHPITYRLDLTGYDAHRKIGGAYDGSEMYKDVAALVRLRNDPTGDDTPISARSIYCGRNCAERLELYHRLAHFWLATGWSCHKWVVEQHQRLPPKKLAELVRDGKAPELVSACYKEYKQTLRDADTYRAGYTGKSAYERMN